MRIETKGRCGSESSTAGLMGLACFLWSDIFVVLVISGHRATNAYSSVRAFVSENLRLPSE